MKFISASAPRGMPASAPKICSKLPTAETSSFALLFVTMFGLVAGLRAAEPRAQPAAKSTAEKSAAAPLTPTSTSPTNATAPEEQGLKHKPAPTAPADTPKANFAAGSKSASTPEAKPDSAAALNAESSESAWPTGLESAKRRARGENRPLLVRAGASWCGPCRKLDEELAKPQIQQELRRWSLVYIDTDAAPEEALSLDISPIPAPRVVNARGKVVASSDGYLPADELLAWLRENFSRGGGTPNPLLTAKGSPDKGSVEKLVVLFQLADPLDREAAIRRLAPYPHAAAAATIDAFSKGKLATRLAILELLQEWKAPIANLDPWRPETVTPERQAALRKWAESLPSDSVAAAAALKPEEAADARRQLARLASFLTPRPTHWPSVLSGWAQDWRRWSRPS